ncbi:MAG TPA: 5-(carboxyamino)imidazole ribonucleotide synthase [Pirellulaceae bacterium]|nr:5-(carboxyamino)imidazole ribonucleotide synthase [Pirellulaceae bacterium]
MTNYIAPGAALGVLGSGQLGRMFAIAARRLGYRVHVFSPDSDTPTGQVADVEIKGAYDDLDAVSRFAQSVSVVTFEFENVPAATTAACEKFVPVRPGGNVLHVTQHRLREKTYLQQAGVPVTPFAAVRSLEDLHAALATLGLPAVLKTAAWGYDGKGQRLIKTREEADAAWLALNTDEAILEAFIPFECEISVVAARGLDGQFVYYGPMRNAHRHHILDVSTVPAGIGEQTTRDAIEITRTVFDALDVVGVLCVEFFVTARGELLINELAPRPHNSGHVTIDAHVSCQFEQQVRAVCGLPLGSAEQLRPAAMANLLGDLWQSGGPNWQAALALEDVKLHLYGKAEARPGRKMGHLTALAATGEQAAARVIRARELLLSPH